MIAVAAFAFGFALNAQQSIVSNYFEKVLKLSGPQFGYITAIREIPGFLLIFMAAALYRVSLPKLSAAALALLAFGYFGFGFSVNFWTALLWLKANAPTPSTWATSSPSRISSLRWT